MALLTAQSIVKTGLAPVYSAVNSSDTIAVANGVQTFLHVKNGNASPSVVTLVDNGKTPAGSAATNPTVSVPATTGDRMIGPISAALADPTTGLVTVQYSVTATVTAALVTI
jgi:hypothetical protein